MSTLVATKTRSITLTLPEPLAATAEEMARQERIGLDELFRRALRSYEIEKIQLQIALARPDGAEDQYMTMDEVCAYIKSTRSQGEERESA